MIKSRDAYEQGEITMDLLKMHPMARKMNVHNEAFAKALEANEPEAARMHLSEIKKLSSYLEEDLVFAIRKAEVAASDPLTVFANGVPTASYSDSGSGFDPSNRSIQLPGTVMSARNSRMQKARSTFGRYVGPGE
jgi:hypothetical protein